VYKKNTDSFVYLYISYTTDISWLEYCEQEIRKNIGKSPCAISNKITFISELTMSRLFIEEVMRQNKNT
jgi:hypothetical protein